MHAELLALLALAAAAQRVPMTRPKTFAPLGTATAPPGVAPAAEREPVPQATSQPVIREDAAPLPAEVATGHEGSCPGVSCVTPDAPAAVTATAAPLVADPAVPPAEASVKRPKYTPPRVHRSEAADVGHVARFREWAEPQLAALQSADPVVFVAAAAVTAVVLIMSCACRGDDPVWWYMSTRA